VKTASLNFNDSEVYACMASVNYTVLFLQHPWHRLDAEYYLGGNWHLDKNTDLFGAIHYVQTNLNGLRPRQYQNPMDPNRSYLSSEYYYQFVGYLKFSWWYNFFKFRGYASVSNFSEQVQIQSGLGVDVYPTGNAKFYIRTDLRWQYAPDNDFFTPGLILNQKMGIQVWKFVWTEVFYQVGKVSNYVDEDAFVVYNAIDPIDWWYGVKFDFYLFDYRLKPYYVFQRYRQTNYYLDGTVTQSTGYFTSTHLVGLKWNFNSP
jgi:hypothetical protein